LTIYEPTPVFGLTREQLRPIVQSATGEAVTSFAISFEHDPPEPYGAAGEKAIPTFDYVTKNGRAGRGTRCSAIERL